MHGNAGPERPGVILAPVHYKLKPLGKIIPVRIKKRMEQVRGKMDVNQGDPLVSGNGNTALLAGKKK